MNRIARSFLIAAPLSLAALTMTTATAHADTPGPIIVMPSEPDQPAPDDIANPAPVPPQDIANPTPAPEPDPAPVPDDKAPLPQDDPNPGPQGPGDITDVPDCTHGCEEDPTPDFPLDSGEGDEDEDVPDEPQDDPNQTDEVEAPEVVPSVTTPTRVDAGLGGDADNGLELSWLLAGGAVVTAGGAALAARRRTAKA